MIKLPKVLGVAEARSELSRVLDEVGRGETFIIKGTKGKEAFMIGAESFRGLQEAYVELVGELETMRILQDERAMNALRSVSEEGDNYPLSEVEGMVPGDES